MTCRDRDGIVRDTTQRRELERRVQDMQRHESLSMMAAGVAHDFNNLLTAILGHAGLLKAEPPEDPAQLIEQ
ncbi:MAG: hypothetical protein KDC48_18430, partial [Planctomycetes bacterium]|nr:hypothetical protein [Planctomycetota bacterium]